jgi:Mor family transcriptional regulator
VAELVSQGGRGNEEAHTAINLWHLPTVLREIAERIGLDGALKLITTYGGTRIYVPKQINPGHSLALLLGEDAAAELANFCGGREHFDIPKAQIAICALRDEKIRADRSAGHTVAELARRYNLTERRIRHITN